MAVGVRNERESRGKALTGVRFAPHFDAFLMNLAALSPQRAQFICETFAGCAIRSQQEIHAKNSAQLANGLALQNFE